MDWIKSNRQLFKVQAEQFSAGIVSYGEGLNLTSGEVTGFGAQLTVYSDDLALAAAAKAASDAAYETILTDQRNLVKLMRKYNVRMQASAAINNAKRAEIGIPIPATPSTIEPKTVTGLLATAFENGEVKLKWNRTGNAQGVIFNIEVSDDSVNWDLLTTSTATKIKLSGYTPGEKKTFRIVATRGELIAGPSNLAVIYDGGSGVSLSLAA
ncbi:MAG: hypothetical protein K8R88_03705 [Armatimonadetes bacterium]|nr:hypothetical protein [Armatimonadota bacterium]